MYTPQQTVEYESTVKSIYKEKYSNVKLLGNVFMYINAYFKIPKSAKKKEKIDMLSGNIRPIKKPDWDNVGKIISDSLNELAYHDDSQIVSANVEKWYSDNPRVEVILKGDV